MIDLMKVCICTRAYNWANKYIDANFLTDRIIIYMLGIWRLKRIGQDGFPGVDALGRKVSPEGIAAYESELAAIQRLRDLGIKDLYLGTNNLANIGNVMMYLNGYVQSALERKIKIKKILDIKRRQKSPVLPYYEKAYNKLDYQYKEAKKHQEIAK